MKLDLMDCRDQKEVQEHQDQMGQRVILDQRVVLENQELKVSWECQGRGASQDLLVQREMQDLLVTKDLKAKLGLMV